MELADMSPKRRLEVVNLALDAVLRKATAAQPTAEVVKGIAEILNTKETGMIAGILDRSIKPTHPSAEETGETFLRYGRLMKRWHWLPAGATARRKPTGLVETPAEQEARAARQRAAEADELFTIHPEDDQ